MNIYYLVDISILFSYFCAVQYCTGVIVQARAMWYPSNIPVHSNGEVLSTLMSLCEKRHDAIVVMAFYYTH